MMSKYKVNNVALCKLIINKNVELNMYLYVYKEII
jgi:hypothetical protein